MTQTFQTNITVTQDADGTMGISTVPTENGKKVLTMGKQHLSRDDRLIMKGKLQGTRENMDMVAMVLMDKCGWHVFEETSDSRDTHSIAYLYECLEKLAEEINEGRIKRKHIKDVLKDECGVVFGD